MKSMLTNKKTQKGITLIALVVTIIVLLILAGISIMMLTGQNGILNRAEEASYKSKLAELKENLQLDIADLMMEKTGNELNKEELREILVKYFGEENVPELNDAKWDKFPEGFILKTEDEKYEVDIAEIYNMSLSSLAAGSKTKIPEGKEWGENVTPVADGNGNVIPVPKGFSYLEGTKDTGFVIKDGEGNEFVWIPCTIEQYKKHIYEVPVIDDRTANISDGINKDKGWNTYDYRNYSDWQEDENEIKENKSSIGTYDGFYIARYEAGVPSNADFYVNKELVSTKEYAVSKNINVSGLKPVSKKGMQPWNCIMQYNAEIVSKNMYNEDSYGVTSKLVDGIAWDRIVDWLSNKYADIEKDSTSKGNYANNQNGIIAENTIYAEHLRKYENGNKLNYCIATRYKYGIFKSGCQTNYEVERIEDYNDYGIDTEDTKYTYDRYAEMATGASENTKLNNIYDMAGNMCEWTTEYGYHDQSSTTKYVVARGGNAGDKGGLNYDGAVSVRTRNA